MREARGMALENEKKQEIIGKFRKHDKDTGSTEVQVALLSERITYLTGHMKSHVKDFNTRRGLIKMVNQRRRLLDYMKSKNVDGYKELLKTLNLRK
jgi:small subunit ribosomal protein S15